MAPISWKWFWTILPSVLLLGAVAVALVMAYRLWEEMHEDDESASDVEVLDDLERAHAAGEIDDAEFLKIRTLMNLPMAPESQRDRKRLKEQVAEPNPTPAGENSPPGSEPGSSAKPSD